jgi:anti-anti-sigma factor
MDIIVSQAQARVPVSIFQLKGSFDSASYEQFDTRVKELLQAGTRNVLIDLSQVNYISSAGVRSLVSLVKQLHSAEEEKALEKAAIQGHSSSPHLKLVGVGPKVMSVLQMSGMDMILDIRKTQAEGLAAF